MSAVLNQRAILRGVQCVCGQWWPDYVMRGETAIMECCGSTYQHASMSDHSSMLCLMQSTVVPPLGGSGEVSP